MNVVDIINKKKRGQSITKDEIYFMVNGYTDGKIPDYQMSAFLMAVCFVGMSEEETYNFTVAMRDTGDILDLSNVKGVVVDKHSTGGVGDKVSLVLGPMVAAAGVPVAKMSGRGLGHTGGTIDKLESFEGFNVSPDNDEFIKNVNEIGISWAGQTGNLAPADKMIYALRDVTGTVDSMPLIASSIMSKKLASGADGIVLDVTYGSGAFMKTKEDAYLLAKMMVDIGKREGKKMSAVITSMEEPLGFAVGNALEVIEAIEVLEGGGPKDVRDVSVELGAHMLLLNGRCDTKDEAVKLLEDIIDSGKALEVMEKWIERQGGNREAIRNTELFKKAKYKEDVCFESECMYVEKIDGEMIGRLVLELGGGRKRKDDVIDMSVGVILKKKVGDIVLEGDCLITICGNNKEKINNAKKLIKDAYTFKKDSVSRIPVIYKEIV